MRPRIYRGDGIRGLLNYTLGKDGGELLDTIGLLGETPRDLAQEFAFFRALKPEAAKPVYDLVLSWPAKEELTRERIIEASRAYLERTMPNCPFVIVLHQDTENLHVHLVGLRIDIDGQLVRDSWERVRAQRTCEELEEELGFLREDRNQSREPKTDPDPGDGDTAATRAILAESIAEAQSRDSTFEALGEALAARGWTLEAIRNSGGEVQGLGLRSPKHYFKFSALNRAWSYSKLIKTQNMRWQNEHDTTQERKLQHDTKHTRR